ncbi:hypothetical protein MRB53_015843 [Persea americana]|uniref:Uncharacterized protein n=1 Tax=Persea americana TaxID=3435 RepID=A0ACC2M1G7_PERAE|nr:hypothetical protein MRB53_015843 [Persea americana]
MIFQANCAVNALAHLAFTSLTLFSFSLPHHNFALLREDSGCWLQPWTQATEGAIRELENEITAATEAETLVEWKSSLTTSGFLSSWSVSNATNLCHWTGITCYATGSAVKIILPASNLTGTLDEFDFASLANLTQLNLNLNLLVGAIPSNISALSKLTHLDLSGNNFTQPIPSTIGHLSELLDLRLYNNSLSGVSLTSFSIFKSYTTLISD